MARRKAVEEGAIQPGEHITPDGPVMQVPVTGTLESAPVAVMHAEAPAEAPAATPAAEANGNGHAAKLETPEESRTARFTPRKPAIYVKPNSFDTVNTETPKMRVESGKGNNVLNRDGSRGSFLILLDKRPPDDAIDFLKAAGYGYELADEKNKQGTMAWKKYYDSDEGWSVRQEIDHRKVADDLITEYLGGRVQPRHAPGR